MAAAATEEDTELRDLLVQTLESSGVLNKIKVGGRRASCRCTRYPTGRGQRWLAPVNGPAGAGIEAPWVPYSLAAAGVPGWGPLSASRPGAGVCFPRGASRPLGLGLGAERGPAPASPPKADMGSTRKRGPEAWHLYEVCPATAGV